MTRWALPLLALLTGCFPDLHAPTAAQVLDADRVGLELEEWDGIELTDEEWDCLESFRVGYASMGEVSDLCNAPARACTFTDSPLDRRNGAVILANDVPLQDWLMRHELLHLALHCVYGDADEKHTGSYWTTDPPLPVVAAKW